jgi:hypothetical protein
MNVYKRRTTRVTFFIKENKIIPLSRTDKRTHASTQQQQKNLRHKHCFTKGIFYLLIAPFQFVRFPKIFCPATPYNITHKTFTCMLVFVYKQARVRALTVSLLCQQN